MTDQLRSFLSGRWHAPSGKRVALVNPATEDVVAETSSDGLDLKAALAFARDVGRANLAKLSFAERGQRLQKLADLVHEKRDHLIEAGVVNAGNTRGDAKFDVDGAAATLAAYADEAARIGGAGGWLVDGEAAPIGRSAKLAGQHVWVPIEGAAVHVNAFNFPAWGLLEKAACAWLAGVPVVSKPATATALMAWRLAELIVESGILPDGAFSFLAGPAADLLDHVDERDAVAFTGSSDTGAWMRGLEHVRRKSVRLNVEADSLNAAVLGPDVTGEETFDLFVNDVVRDMTQKAGQKCTAIRRVFVPEATLDSVKDALTSRLVDVRVGDPAQDGVTMGPIATASALKNVTDGLARLTRESRVVHRGAAEFARRPDRAAKGFFQEPVLLEVDVDSTADAVHSIEVFGPCATLIPYRGADGVGRMIRDVKRGGGGLVASIYTDDRAFLRTAVDGLAASHGRLFIGSKKSAGGSPGPGTALPQLLHGGPGRAGGGTELGGVRGLHLYMQRVALEGYGPLVEWLAKR